MKVPVPLELVEDIILHDKERENSFTATPLQLLMSLFGLDEDGWGPLRANYGLDGKLLSIEIGEDPVGIDSDLEEQIAEINSILVKTKSADRKYRYARYLSKLLELLRLKEELLSEEN